MDDANGGASAVNMLQHAVRAIEAGDAETIVLCAGTTSTARRSGGSWRSTTARPPSTSRRWASGPERPLRDGDRALARRARARPRRARRDPRRPARVGSREPGGAVYRDPLTLEDYLASPFVAEPLTRYDCVPVVTGADAIVVTASPAGGRPHVRVRAVAALHNPDHQQGDGFGEGFTDVASRLWPLAGVRPEDVDAAFLYDDYPVMVAVQAEELGIVPGGDIARWLQAEVLEARWPLNTSGGQLSAGQAGAAGGMHGLVEAVRQLRGDATGRRAERSPSSAATGWSSCATARATTRPFSKHAEPTTMSLAVPVCATCSRAVFHRASSAVRAGRALGVALRSWEEQLWV